MIERKWAIDTFEKMDGIENLRAKLLQNCCRTRRNFAFGKTSHRRRLRQSFGRLVHIGNERGRALAEPRKNRVFDLLVGINLHGFSGRARHLPLVLAEIESGNGHGRGTYPMSAAPSAIFLQIAGCARGYQRELFGPVEGHVKRREMTEANHMRIPASAIADKINCISRV